MAKKHMKKHSSSLSIKELNIKTMLSIHLSWILVAHACNPSYSEGRDQEDCGSKPASEL
jgi:hypothetical protein